LQEIYNVQPLYVSEFKNPDLRKICSGSPRSKLAAIWESPFDKFLCIDSDVILWGDVTSKLNLNEYDFISLTNWRSSPRDKSNIRHFFFDPDKIHQVDPDFDWLNLPLFCAGAFACKKNCLDVNEYLNLESFAEINPGIFNFAEQGIFNFMVMKAHRENKIKLDVANLQYIVVDHAKQLTVDKFHVSDVLKNSAKVTDPTLIHFCGEKPLLQYSSHYSEVFTAFRLAYYKKKYGISFLSLILPWGKIFIEELQVALPKIKRKIHGFFNSNFRV